MAAHRNEQERLHDRRLMPTTALAAETYNLWVGGVQITSANAADVFNDGKVSYNATTNTLTLNNYTYSGAGHDWGGYGKIRRRHLLRWC